MLPVAGRFSAGSRLPQYLTRATFTLARAVESAPTIWVVGSCNALSPSTHVHGLTDHSKPIGQAPSQKNPVGQDEFLPPTGEFKIVESPRV